MNQGNQVAPRYYWYLGMARKPLHNASAEWDLGLFQAIACKKCYYVCRTAVLPYELPIYCSKIRMENELWMSLLGCWFAKTILVSSSGGKVSVNHRSFSDLVPDLVLLGSLFALGLGTMYTPFTLSHGPSLTPLRLYLLTRREQSGEIWRDITLGFIHSFLDHVLPGPLPGLMDQFGKVQPSWI